MKTEYCIFFVKYFKGYLLIQIIFCYLSSVRSLSKFKTESLF